MGQAQTRNEKHLIKRYLLWCYKTTKEELDRVDRKFTQLRVDAFILQNLNSSRVTIGKNGDPALEKNIAEFKKYIENKRQDALREKYQDPQAQELNSRYSFLQKRLGSIQKAVISFLGRKALQEIEANYEREMEQRILQERVHR